MRPKTPADLEILPATVYGTVYSLCLEPSACRQSVISLPLHTQPAALRGKRK